MEEQSANGGGENHETSGHAGASSEAEQQKEGLAPGERESIAAQRQTHVKSLARGMMEKRPEGSAGGPITEVQARFQKQKASRVTRGKTGKPDFARKSVRGAKNKASKAGKVGFRGKAGRKAVAKGAKKGTRGGLSKQTGRPVGKGDRRSALGRGPGSRGQGRTSAKGGRGKTGARQRPSPRRSYR